MEGKHKIKDEKVNCEPIGTQVIHVRENSDSELQALFDSVLNPKSQMPLQKPLKMRNLPASFFIPPSHRQSPAPTVSHSREGSSDSTYSSTGTQLASPALSRVSANQPQHFRHHSSPATLQQTLSVAPQSQHVHQKQHSFDALADELPPGWEQARTSQGQIYYLNHATQTTTWEDPRKKLSTTATVSLNQVTSVQPPPPANQSHQHQLLNQTINSNSPSPKANSSCSTTPVPSPVPMAVSPAPSATPSVALVNPNLGSLPPGWEQGISQEGEIYFINHADKSTSWFDPRLPRHLQTAGGLKSLSGVGSNGAPPVDPQQAHQRLHYVAYNGVKRHNHLFMHHRPNHRFTSEEITRNQLEFARREAATAPAPTETQQRTINALISQQRGTQATLAATSGPMTSLPGASNEVSMTTSMNIASSQSDPLYSTDIHSRQESADSGLGLGSNYTHPHTPEDFLASMEDVEISPSEELKQPAPSPMVVVSELESMDSEDLVPSLTINDELSTDFLNDMLEPSKINFPTWL